MHRPRLTITLPFRGQQITIQRIQVDARQYRLAALEQLIVADRPHPRQILTSVDPARFDHRRPNDAMHRTQGDRLIQQVTEKGDYPPQRAVTQQQ
jgi:hypothetical protein